jgi:hypothetical protein
MDDIKIYPSGSGKKIIEFLILKIELKLPKKLGCIE